MARFPVLLAAALVSCSAYDGRFRYPAAPQEANVTLPSGQLAAAAYARAVGVRRAAEESGMAECVEIAFYLRNQLAEPIVVESSKFRLFTADLAQLGPPLAEDGRAAAEPVVPGGQEWSAVLLFPFPAGREADDFDLDGLNLQWQVQAGGDRYVGSFPFERLHPHPLPYPRPLYWDYPFCPPYPGYWFHVSGHIRR